MDQDIKPDSKPMFTTQPHEPPPSDEIIAITFRKDEKRYGTLTETNIQATPTLTPLRIIARLVYGAYVIAKQHGISRRILESSIKSAIKYSYDQRRNEKNGRVGWR